jgi:hypothetical protein
MKRYALKGINDDESMCAVCGKVELKRVMWLVELDADGNAISEPFNCGTTCGAKLLGYTQSKITTKVKNYSGLVCAKREELYRTHPSAVAGWKMLYELNRIADEDQRRTGVRMGWAERSTHPLFIEHERLDKEAHEWANAQEILIAL